MIHCGHSSCSAAGLCGATDDSPGLRDGVNAAFFVLRGAERGAVIKVSAAIPFAVPAFALERRFQQTYVNTPLFHALAFSSGIRHLCELPKNRVQEPT